MKRITKKFLVTHNACTDGLIWVEENGLIGLPADQFLEKLINADKLNWANWLIVRVMTRTQCLQYAIFAAHQVLPLFEQKYLNELHLRKAVEAAERCLKNDTRKNRATAWAVGAAAWAAAEAARDVWVVGAEMHKILKYGLNLIKK